jgi:serine/threonine protein kinase
VQSDRHAHKGTAAATGDPLTGRLLDGRYRVGPRIARGGMASVYEATDIRLDRTVAVKVMHPGMGDDEEFAARFVREARAAARLSHPHVVAVYDQGKEDGTVYLAMELVPGHTLRDVIRKESPMPPARALALLEPVLSALGGSHPP